LCASVPLTPAGSASCTATITLSSAATDIVTATYGGDSNYPSSTSTTTVAITNNPSPGGFSAINLSCKRNSDGSAQVTGLYSVTFPSGWSLLADAWPTQYLAGTGNTCQNPSYNAPPGGPQFVSGEYLTAHCTPVSSESGGGTQSCFNSSSASVNAWVTLNSSVSSYEASNGSVLIEMCRYPNPTQPGEAIFNVVPCN
jgi:hypothetical protein